MESNLNEQLLNELLTWFQLSFGDSAWQNLKSQLLSDQPENAIAQLRDYYAQHKEFFDQKLEIRKLETLAPDNDK